MKQISNNELEALAVKMNKHSAQPPCISCGTKRRLIRAKKMCGKCLYRTNEIKNCESKLRHLEENPEHCKSGSVTILLSRIAQAKRIIAELKWREECLSKRALATAPLAALICAIARDCRSEVSPALEKNLEMVSGESRRVMFEALLPIVETFPCLRPSLHEHEHPIVGLFYQKGWLNWNKEYIRSEAFSEGVFRGRRLKEAGRKKKSKSEG